MKNITILFLAILISGHTHSQWRVVNYQGNDKIALAVASADTALYTNYQGGRIFRLNDSSGYSYQTQFTTEWFMDIDFPAPGIGYACGGSAFGFHQHVVIKTTNNGDTWDSLTANAFGGYTFDFIDFVNKDTGVVASTGYIFQTLDGGQSFTQKPDVLPTYYSITQIEHGGPRLHVAISKLLDNSMKKYAYALYYSDDMANTWQLSYADTMVGADGLSNREIRDIQFLDALHGFAVGGNGLFLKTTDGGASWTQSFISPSGGLHTVWFTSPLIGYTDNLGGIYMTIDGGISWTPQVIFSPSIIHDIEFANDSVGYALGDDALYKTTNGGANFTSIKDIEALERLISIYPNPARELIHIDKPSNIRFEKSALYDISGRLIRTLNPHTSEVDVSSLSSGVYLLRFRTEDGVDLEKSLQIMN